MVTLGFDSKIHCCEKRKKKNGGRGVCDRNFQVWFLWHCCQFSIHSNRPYFLESNELPILSKSSTESGKAVFFSKKKTHSKIKRYWKTIAWETQHRPKSRGLTVSRRSLGRIAFAHPAVRFSNNVEFPINCDTLGGTFGFEPWYPARVKKEDHKVCPRNSIQHCI